MTGLALNTQRLARFVQRSAEFLGERKYELLGSVPPTQYEVVAPNDQSNPGGRTGNMHQMSNLPQTG